MKRKKSKRNKKNLILKVLEIVCAIISGGYLTASLSSFAHSQLKLSFLISSAISLSVVIVLNVLILFHKPSRCFFFLLIPQVLSKRGRTALVAYTFLLAFTGPLPNLMKNVGVLSDSIACGQGQLNKAFHELMHAIKEPYQTIKTAVEKILPSIKTALETIKEIMSAFKSSVHAIVEVFRKALNWLKDVVNFCHLEEGSPHDHCLRAIQKATIECQSKLGAADVLCDATRLGKGFCYNLEVVEGLCELFDFMSLEELRKIIKTTEKFIKEIEDVFFISVEFHHSFDFKTNSSKSVRVIHAEIMQEILDRSHETFKYFSFFGAFASFFVLWMLINTLQYQYKFINQLRFKNVFITKIFRDIDQKRVELKMENVLPLTKRERKSFVQITTFKLVKQEFRMVFEKSIFLLVTTIHLCGILLADYSLFWFLSMVQFYGNHVNGIESEVEMIAVKVTGQGIVAEICQELVKIFKPLIRFYDAKLNLCLPRPHYPDYPKYAKIGLLIMACWILLFVEPFGLRLRCVIMDYNYPDIASERAAWLYHHILRKRTTFLDLARRQLKRTFGKKLEVKEDSKTCLQIFRSKVMRFWICRKIVGTNKDFVCVLCGRFVKSIEDLIKCQSSDCPGNYCVKCFHGLKNKCSMCEQPIGFEDLNHSSEELDSSEDEIQSFKSTPLMP